MLGGDIKKEIGIGWVGYAPGCKKQGIFWGDSKKKEYVVGGWVARAPWNVSIYGGNR